jgi:methionyl-tRNA formyltransferase
LHQPETKRVAHAAGVDVQQPERLKGPAGEATREWLRGLGADLFVVMAYGQILSREVLDMPRLGCINLHASILPRHRGASPIQAAIAEGDRCSGITVMMMAEGLDTGDIVLVKTTPIHRRETGGTLHDRLAELAPVALAEALERFANGTGTRTSQDEALATYAPKLDRKSGQIDWRNDARTIERRIRAMQPWPGAYTRFANEKGDVRTLKVFSAIVLKKINGEPGRVLEIARTGIVVGCGEGALLLRSVQMEGRKRVDAVEFARGTRVSTGMELLSE